MANKSMAFMLAGSGTTTLEIDIYSDVGEGGPIGPMGLFGWKDAVSASDVRNALRNSPDVTQIMLRINSDGGDVLDGFAIYNLLNDHPAKVICSVDGVAASIASVITMAADEIVMAPGSWMMIHEAWGGKVGAAEELRAWADVLDKMSEQAATIYAARTKLPIEKVRKLMAAETWMTADEALKLGFCDKVADIKVIPDKPSDAPAMSADSGFAMMRLSDFRNVPPAVAERVGYARSSLAGRRGDHVHVQHSQNAHQSLAGVATSYKRADLVHAPAVTSQPKATCSLFGRAPIAELAKCASRARLGDL